MEIKPSSKPHTVDHLANERTFLAWIRTSIGIMAFGFVVEKFALFIRQIAFFLTKEAPIIPENSLLSKGYAQTLGIFLVALGALIGLLSYFRFIQIQKQIEQETYKTSNKLAITLIVLVLAMAIFLLIYLINT